MLTEHDQRQIDEVLAELPLGHYLDGVYADRYFRFDKRDIGYMVFLRETDLITGKLVTRHYFANVHSEGAASNKVDEIDAYIEQRMLAGGR